MGVTRMSLGADVYGIVFEKGEIVCREGDPGDTMYIIQSGAVKISRNREGEEMVLAILEQGEFFGEMALVDQQPRSATVSTMSRTRLLPLTRTSFLQRTSRDPGISLHLIKILGERINRTLSLLRSKINESLSEGGDGNQEFDSAPLAQSENDPQDFLISPPEKMASAGVGNLREEGLAYGPRLQVPYGWLPSEQQGRWYEPDQVIFQAGDPCEAMYLILQGSVETRQHLEGKEILASRLEPGDLFGEVALLTDQPHTTTALSKERTCLVPIRIDQLFEEIKVNSELVLHIVKLLILRLRSILAALAAPEQSVILGRQCLPPLLRPKGRISCAVVPLSSCGGCSAALLDDQEEIGKLLEKVNITYCPMLLDECELGEVDVVLVEGVARVKEDEEKLIEARQKARFLVAWGTCAAFGGIPAMANRFELEELLQESYGESLDPFAYYLSGTRGVQRFMYQAREFGLLRLAHPVDHLVRVDYYLPGCPPPMRILIPLIAELTGNPMEKGGSVICAECGRKPKRPEEISEVGLDPQICFLSQGIVCFGSLTKGGCGGVCPRGGLPCWGCRGPAGGVVKKIREGQTYNDIMLKILRQRSQMEDERLKPIIRFFSTQANNALNFPHILRNDVARIK
jgi:F420-non-reducing hydrogenase small subunit